MKRCNSCKRIVKADGAKFCAYCGSSELAELSVCPSCGRIVEQGYKFCAYCGESVNAETKRDTTDEAAVARENLDVRIHSWLEPTDENIYKDYTVRRNDPFSYCIRDNRPNDLRIIKTYTVEPNTLYIATADIKVSGVVNVENKVNPLGATISIGDNSISRSLMGTADWQTVRAVGLSDESGVLTLSLNLGYFSNTVTGSAWFENIRIDRAKDVSAYSDWRFLALILTDTGIDTFDSDTNSRITLSHRMSDEEIEALKKSLYEFQSELAADGDGLFGVELDVIEARVRCTDYTKVGCGYTITAESAYLYLQSCGIDISSYDHIFMITCLPGLPASYYGLGGLFIRGKVGFSFILHRDVEHYLGYLSRIEGWEWPAAVYVHEFLHSIENYSSHLGFKLPSIHDGGEFGYPDSEEWRLWYRDYIRKDVARGNEFLGVEPLLWRLPPSRFS